MRRQLLWILVLSVGMAVSATGLALAYNEPIVIRAGNLIIRANGGITPTVLPKYVTVPITASTSGSVSTVDGSHPSAAEKVVVNIDKSFAINARGLPACKISRITASSTAIAKRACPNSIVGTGFAKAQVAFSDQRPFSAHGPLIFFNGGTRGGTTLLLIHLYAPLPAPTAVVASVAITKFHKGHYGLQAVARIPVIAGGSGSVTGFRFTINRKFSHNGMQQGYLEAKCPTGKYFTEIQALFKDGSLLHGTVVRPCTSKDVY